MLKHKKNLHPLGGETTGQFTLNIKECPELLTQDEYNKSAESWLPATNIAQLYRRQTPEEPGARVQDKSFQLFVSAAARGGQGREKKRGK